jgi:hypothetical protein
VGAVERKPEQVAEIAAANFDTGGQHRDVAGRTREDRRVAVGEACGYETTEETGAADEQDAVSDWQ